MLSNKSNIKIIETIIVPWIVKYKQTKKKKRIPHNKTLSVRKQTKKKTPHL